MFSNNNKFNRVSTNYFKENKKLRVPKCTKPFRHLIFNVDNLGNTVIYFV